MMRLVLCLPLLGLAALHATPALAQPIDLSHGGPVDVTANNGLEYDQPHNTVTARGDARAVRGDVTVTADTLIAHLRKKVAGATPAAQPDKPNAASPAGGVAGDAGGNEIYRLEASGNVHIFTPTDQVQGADHGVYDIDQSVLVLTGPALKLTTPQQVMTARDDMEYWSARHMAVGRGKAVVTTSDGRQLAADTLVGYTTDPNQPGAHPAKTDRKADKQPAPGSPGAPPPGTGQLQKVEAFGHVLVRTVTETVTGDRGVYVPDTGIARLAGNVHITRGLNQLNGAEAIVNMKTGISRLIERPGGRVQGLVVPNDAGPGKEPGKGGDSGGKAAAKGTEPDTTP